MRKMAPERRRILGEDTSRLSAVLLRSLLGRYRLASGSSNEFLKTILFEEAASGSACLRAHFA